MISGKGSQPRIEEAEVKLRNLTNYLMQLQGLDRHCTNCDSFQMSTAYCIRWEAKPPPNIIVAGCEEWLDEIPF